LRRISAELSVDPPPEEEAKPSARRSATTPAEAEADGAEAGRETMSEM
jgi:hypothetical protein